MGKGKYRFRTH